MERLTIVTSFIIAVITMSWSWRLGLLGVRSVFMATFWLMTVELAYFFVRLITLAKRKHYAFLATFNRVYIVIALLIQTTFWTVFYYNRELVHSVHLPIPPLLNHFQHSFPLLLCLIDKWYFALERHNNGGVIVIAFAVTGYLFAIWLRALLFNNWSYEFFAILGHGSYGLFVLAGTVIACMIFKYLL